MDAITSFLTRGTYVPVPHWGLLFIPNAVNFGFMVATLLFALAYLTSRLQQR